MVKYGERHKLYVFPDKFWLEHTKSCIKLFMQKINRKLVNAKHLLNI